MTFVSELPQELGKMMGLSDLDIVSINNYSELIFFGGNADAQTITDIWKYKHSDRSWMKVGDLFAVRTDIKALLVPHLECPFQT